MEKCFGSKGQIYTEETLVGLVLHMRIGINGHSLKIFGGIERQMCALASHLSQRGHDVLLFTSDAPHERPLYNLAPGVRLIHHTYNGDKRNLQLFRRLVLSHDPDICISGASDRRHFIWPAVLWGTGIPWVYSEHTEPAFLVETWNAKERIAAMSGADALHMLLPSYGLSIPSFLKDRLTIISNAVLLQPLPRTTLPNGEHLLLAMGRLSFEKQWPLLIKAFCQLAQDFPSWRLELWGEGEKRADLQRQINRTGLQNRMKLPGSTSSPETKYAAASLLCLPSMHEGMPCVLLEAMACGLPSVGFRACGGVNELIEHGRTGLLADEMTAESLAAALRQLMANESLRNQMGEAAQTKAAQHTPERIYAQWENLLVKTAAFKGKARLLAPEKLSDICEEERAHLKDLAHYVKRRNIYLDDSQWMRRFIWQHPELHKVAHNIAPLLRRIRHNIK